MPSDRDDVDARFRELIEANFPERDADPPQRDTRFRPPPRHEPETVLDAMDRADAELDARDEAAGADYRPPPLPPMRRWPFGVSVAVAGMVIGLVVAVAMLIGWRPPGWVGTLAGLGFLVGLGYLLTRRLADRSERHDDGAVV